MQLITGLGFVLIIIGIWGMLTRKNMVKIVLGFSLVDTGIHIIMVSIGYIKGKTAPILNEAVNKAKALQEVVDPVPSVLVLTAIVIGLAVTALMLVYVVRLHKEKNSMQIDDHGELEW
ncbi:MAG: cation:proton antiporter subunit C [Candidatus Cloacimonetes bacterium]|nr:cation:proton antiporter subunit C [Candidatus Cloacimonadota bacterium]